MKQLHIGQSSQIRRPFYRRIYGHFIVAYVDISVSNMWIFSPNYAEYSHNRKCGWNEAEKGIHFPHMRTFFARIYASHMRPLKFRMMRIFSLFVETLVRYLVNLSVWVKNADEMEWSPTDNSRFQLIFRLLIGSETSLWPFLSVRVGRLVGRSFIIS